MAYNDSLHSLSEMYSELERRVAPDAGANAALQAVTTVAARSLPGVDAASITRRRANTYETVTSTDDIAARGDALQYQLGQGPCVDAVDKDKVLRSLDLANDPRWPQFGAAAAKSVGVNSLLSIRLTFDDDDAMAGLNLYARRSDAYDDHTQRLAVLLATHAGVIVSRSLAREKAANLEKALATSREIGIAVGVLMTRHKVKRTEAFDLLRTASQRHHRKIRDIAAEVADTGILTS